MKEYYNHNPDFRAYVDKYSRDHGISIDEALQHELVRQYYLYLKGEELKT